MPDMSFVCMYGFILFYVILCQNPIVPNVNVYFFLGIKLHNNCGLFDASNFYRGIKTSNSVRYMAKMNLVTGSP